MNVSRAVALLLAAAIGTLDLSAQTNQDELKALRQHLGLPENAKIEMADSPGLPAATDLKVFLAFGLDMGVRGNFRDWVEEWNRKEGKKHGAIQIVKDQTDADIILARYTVLSERGVQASGGVVGGPYGVVGNSQTYETVPVFAYILTPQPDGVVILWRYASTTTVGETTRSGEQLWKDFKSMLKKRPKAK